MENKKQKENKNGFTLMEVLVMVLIITILAAVAMPSYKWSVEKSRATHGITALSQIAKAQSVYHARNQNYSQDVLPLHLNIKDNGGNSISGAEFNDSYFDYEIFGDSRAGAIAKRTTGEYELYVNYDEGKVLCFSENETTCPRLGLEEGSGLAEVQEDPSVPCNGELNVAWGWDEGEDYVSSNGGTCNVSDGVINYSYCDGFQCFDGRIEGTNVEECETTDEYMICVVMSTETFIPTQEKYCLQLTPNGCEIWGLDDGENYCVVSNDVWSCSSPDANIIETNIVTEHDGMTTTITCGTYVVDGSCYENDISMIEDSKTENGITYSFSCFGDLISDNTCTSYNQMREDDPSNNVYRYCRWIEDNECRAWSFWMEYGVEYAE